MTAALLVMVQQVRRTEGKVITRPEAATVEVRFRRRASKGVVNDGWILRGREGVDIGG